MVDAVSHGRIETLLIRACRPQAGLDLLPVATRSVQRGFAFGAFGEPRRKGKRL